MEFEKTDLRNLHPCLGRQSHGNYTFDLIRHLQRQKEWSEKTFGPSDRAKGVLDHIGKEIAEVRANPKSLEEWIDIAILALDGAWRAGYSPIEIAVALNAKQEKNESRQWPDWRNLSEDQAIEHVRD